MKKLFISFIAVVLLVCVFVLPVSADENTYSFTPKQLLGTPSQAFVSDGTQISQQSVYNIGDYGFGILPFLSPLSEFEMQFDFQIDSNVSTSDYIVFDMSFDRVTYQHDFTFITYQLYVVGKGTLKEQSFARDDRTDHFTFEGFSLYNGDLNLMVTFTYQLTYVSEEEYFFKDITYFAGSKDNAPIYNSVDKEWTSDIESANNAINEANKDNVSVADDVFTNIPTTFDTFVGSLTFIKAVFVKFFDKLPWLPDMLGISLVCGLFGFLFNMGGSLFSFVRNKNSSKGGKPK